LELYPNCCTSYPIPLALVVRVNGKERSFKGTGLPVWRWCFENGSKRVAFEQETVHGGGGIHYEMRDVKSRKLVSQWNPDKAAKAPPWVEDVDATH
jgi:hypothetical protein